MKPIRKGHNESTRVVEDLVSQSPAYDSTAKAKQEFESVLEGLTPDDIVIDCGANFGKYTVLMAATGATVHAFEPDPEAFAELSKAAAKLTNVTLWNAAVGLRDGEFPLYRSTKFVPNSPQYTASSVTLRRGPPCASGWI